MERRGSTWWRRRATGTAGVPQANERHYACGFAHVPTPEVPMTWVGIDYDTHAVHLVRLPVDGGVPTYHPCRLEGDDAFDRMRRVTWELPGEGFWEDVIAVGIEEPGGKYVVAKLKGVQGAIVANLPGDLLVQPYQAGLWRKLCGLPGNCPKEVVKAWVLGRLGENPEWPQDAFDAYALAYAVSTQVE